MMRDSWDSYFLNMANAASTRSACLRRKVGSVAVKNNRILATGYNGPPPTIMHCAERGGCLREKLNIQSGKEINRCYAIHAEQNLIIQAAITGVNIEGCTVYCTNQPCFLCAKLLAGIKPKRIVYSGSYPDLDTVALFTEIGEMFVNGDFIEWKFNWK